MWLFCIIYYIVEICHSIIQSGGRGYPFLGNGTVVRTVTAPHYSSKHVEDSLTFWRRNYFFFKF